MNNDLRHDPVIATLISIVFSQGERLSALTCRVEALRQIAGVSMSEVERRASEVQARLDSLLAADDNGEAAFRAWLTGEGEPPSVFRS